MKNIYFILIILGFYASQIFAQTGTITVDVNNVSDGSPSLPGTNGSVSLYDQNWNLLATQSTNSSGVTSFTNRSFGTYNIEAYHNPSNPSTIFGQEFWGGTSVNHNSSTTSVTLTRNMPYNYEVRVYNNSTNQDITGQSVPLGTVLRFQVNVRNPGTVTYSVRSRVVIDRDKVTSYDFDQTTSSTNAPGNNQTTTIVLSPTFTPTQTGDYYEATGTQTYINNAWKYTNGGAWLTTKLFTIMPTTGTITVDVNNVSDGSPSLPGTNGSVSLYDQNWNLLATQSTNSSGVTSFTNRSFSTYNIEAYHNPSNPSTIFGQEFWGGTSVNHNSSTTSVTLTRNMPYNYEVRVYNNSTNQDITGQSVPLGTVLRFQVNVRNPGTVTYSVRSRVVIDRDKVTSYDFDQTTSSTNAPGNNQTTTIVLSPTFTPTQTGDYYEATGTQTYINNAWKYTNGGAWLTTKLFTIMPTTGTITVDVNNVSDGSPSLPGTNGSVSLYDQNWNLLATQSTNSSGVTSFTNRSFGTYNIEAYHNPSNPSTIFGQEFWGGTSVNHNSSTTSVTLTRNMPYNYEVRVYNNSTNQDITGQSVPLGTVLRFQVNVRNPGTVTYSVRSRVVIDRDKVTSYDFDQTTSSTNAPGNNQTTTIVLSPTFTPTQTGDYYEATGTQTYINNAWKYTNGGAWLTTKLFTIMPTTGTITVDVNNVSDGSPSLPGTNGSVSLYDQNWNLLATQSTNSSGVTSFTNRSFSTYNIEAYHNPSNPSTIFGQEFWGGTSVNHNSSTTSVTLTRNMPYNYEVRVYNNSTNQDITGQSVPLGTVLRFQVNVRNPGTVTYSVRSRVVIDRDKVTSYDFDQTTSSTNAPGNNQTTTIVLSPTFTPTQTGDYYEATGTQTYINNAWKYTNGGAWLTTKLFSVEDNGNLYNDQIWTTVVDNTSTYEIHLIAEEYISDLNSRPLQESIDKYNVRDIYIKENGINVVTSSYAIELLFKSQSGRKYGYNPTSILDYLDNGIFPTDVEVETRDPWWGSGQYTVWVPTAVYSSFRDMFIYGLLNLNGLDNENSRSDMYADVLLDCILQPDISDEMDEQQELLDELSFLKSFLVDPIMIARMDQIRQATPGYLLTKGEIHTTLNNLTGVVKNVKTVKYLNKLNDAINGISDFVSIGSDAVRFLFLQSLATAQAEERLEAIERWIENSSLQDPALQSAKIKIRNEFENYLENDWYNSLDDILINATVAEVIIKEALTIAIQNYYNLTSLGVKKLLLPYFLSWEVYKLIREQSQNAQHCTIASTLWKQLFNSNRFQYLQGMLSSNVIEYEDVNEFVHLSNISNYLGWYFYNKYLSISNNTLNAWYGNALDYLNLGSWSDYNEFIDYLNDARDEDIELFNLSKQPFYLTRHWMPLLPTATDQEYQFLLSKLRNYIPDITPPANPIEAIFNSNPTEGYAPLIVTFQNYSTGLISEWDWDFGDGTYYSGENPSSHIYNYGGIFQSKLTVSDGTNSDISESITINVKYQPTIANFSANQISGTAPLTVQFTNLSSGNNLTYFWSFGDGNTSNEVSPSHTYENAGVYSIALTASGIGGQDIEFKNSYIDVQGQKGNMQVTTNNSSSNFFIQGPQNFTGTGLNKLFTSVPIGSYTIQYSNIQGFQTPFSETLTLTNGNTIYFSGNYTSNNPPTVANPIADVTVNEDAANTVIDLTNVFTDVDNPVGSITKAVYSNTNSTLVSAAISGNTLTLDYQPNQSGTSTITIRATSGGQTVDDVFLVTVNGVDDPPTVANPIADVTVNEDAANTVIDLTNTFTDVDNPVGSITKAVQGNTNSTLVSAAISGNTLTLDYQPNQSGTSTITIRATSGGQTVDDVFLVTVNGVDDPPTVANPIADVTVNEDAANTVIDLTNVFTDVDNPVGSITKAVYSNTNSTLVSATISGNTLTLDYQPNQSGTSTITIRATSGGQTVDDVFLVTVNGVDDPPTVANPIADVTVNEDAANTVIDLTNTFTDVDNPVGSITKAVYSNTNSTLVGAAISGNTLTLDYQPNQSGTSTITIRATSGGQTVDDVFLVTVNGVDDPPTVANPIADVTVNEDAANTVIDLTNVFTDVDNPVGSITKAVQGNTNSTLVGAAISGNTLTLDYQPNQSGTSTITIRATSGGQTVDDVFLVTVNGVDDPPTVANPIADVTVNEDAANTVIDLTNVFTDVDNPVGSITKAVQGNTNSTLVSAAISGNTLTLDYQPNQSGTSTITIRATSGGQTVDDVFLVTVNGVDDPPTVANPIADVTVNEDAANTVIDLTNVFTDVDNPVGSITKAVQGNTNSTLVSAAISGNTLTLDYQPNQSGTSTITIRATSGGQTVDDVFLVTVNGVDDPPTVANPIADVTVNEDAANTVIDLTNTFTDVDNPVGSITKAVQGNTNSTLVSAAISGNTLTLDYQPNQSGTSTITIRATSGGQTVDDVFLVTVKPVNDPPQISTIPLLTFNEDDSLIYSLRDLYNHVSDPDTPDSLLIVELKTGKYVNTRIYNNWVILKAITNWNGQDTLHAIVSDGQLSDSTDVYVAVHPINDPPLFVNLPDTVKFINTSNVVLTMKGYVKDVDLPADSIRFQFSVDEDSILIDYDEVNTELTLNAPEYIGVGILKITVSDNSGAEDIDSIIVQVEQEPSSVSDFLTLIPKQHELYQNYPNPFNPITHIKFGLPLGEKVKIVVYNILGQQVQILLDEFKPAGYHIVEFNTSLLSSGIYFYQIQTQKFVHVKKMILLR